jgi:hypothetical protein
MGIKKRFLVGAATGTMVFGAVLGMAAGLDVSSGDKLGSGQATVTSCDLDGVTTSYVFDGPSGDVTAIWVRGIDDNCDDATATVGASHSDSDTTNTSNPDPMMTGHALVRTFASNYDDNVADNIVLVPLDTPMSAELFNTVTVTLHGGLAPLPYPGRG